MMMMTPFPILSKARPRLNLCVTTSGGVRGVSSMDLLLANYRLGSHNAVHSFSDEEADCTEETQARRNCHDVSLERMERGLSVHSLDQNQYRLSISWPGTCQMCQSWPFSSTREDLTLTFIPHMPVMMFIGRTMVPRTVNFPKTSAFRSDRLAILTLIWAR